MGLPLFIYDGDCGFCRYWMSKWKNWAGPLMETQSFQTIYKNFPEIDLADFKTASYFIDENRKFYRGSDGIFRSFLYMPSKRWLFYVYRWAPGFSAVSRGVYWFVAKNRTFLSKWFIGEISCSTDSKSGDS